MTLACWLVITVKKLDNWDELIQEQEWNSKMI